MTFDSVLSNSSFLPSEQDAKNKFAPTDSSTKLSQQAFTVPETYVRTAGNENSQQNTVDKIIDVLQALPTKFELPKSAIPFALSQSGADADPQVGAMLKGVTRVTRDGNHFELQRNEATHIPLNQDVVKGLVSMKSLDLDTLKFDLDVNSNPKKISRISGLDLTFSAFGHDQSVAIQEAQISHDTAGNTVITGIVESPIPPAARTVLDIGDRVPVTIKLTPDGRFIAPLASNVLRSVSETTGQSLPGMIMRDELGDAAEVARFAERYPKWVGDTVTPILTGLEQVVADNQRNAQEARNNPQVNVNPSDRSTSSLPLSPDRAPNVAPSDGPSITPGSGDRQVATPASGSTTSSSDRRLTAPDKFVTASPADNTAVVSTANNKPDAHGDIDKTIKVDGVERHYILHIPKGYDGKSPTPMIVALHGMGGNAKEFEQQTKLNAIADKEGYIVAYPDSTQWFGQKDWKTWDTNNGILPPGKHADDVKFLRSVIDNTQSEFKVDDQRIFMAGISNGGMETFHAAAGLSDKLAAIAIVSGAMSGKEESPTAPMSVLNIHGTADTIIPIGGIENVPDSLTHLGIPTFKPNSYIADYWKTKNGITGAPQTVVEGKETRQTYVNPKTGAEVEQIVEAGGQHVPSNIPKTMNTIVDFFDRHTKIEPTAENIPPANDPPRDTRKPIDPVERLKANIQKRGVIGLEADVDRALSAVPMLSDGSISPSKFFHTVDSTIHLNWNDPVSSFIRTTNSISKSGEHINIDRSETAVMPVNYEVPGTGGLLNLKDVEVGTTSFDLKNNNGLFSIENLNGLRIKADVLGHDLTSNVKQLTETHKPDGNHIYSLKVSHPLPSFARFVLMQPDDVNVNIELDSKGNPSVVNQKQVMDEALGRNYFVRGGIDEATDIAAVVNNPNFATIGNVVKDVGITGGSTYLGSKFGSRFIGGKFGFIGGAVGFVAAPIIIHGINELRS